MHADRFIDHVEAGKTGHDIGNGLFQPACMSGSLHRQCRRQHRLAGVEYGAFVRSGGERLFAGTADMAPERRSDTNGHVPKMAGAPGLMALT